MAIYQYFLAVVPLTGVNNRHSKVPETIFVNTESKYFGSDVGLYWNEAETEVDEILPQLDKIVDRADWGNDQTSFNWKTYSEKLDNDAAIYLNKETLKIEEFSFRADLREKNLIFLKNMIELGKLNNWMFMDRHGKLLKPDFEAIKKSIKNSNAYKFLKDPKGYLDGLG